MNRHADRFWWSAYAGVVCIALALTLGQPDADAEPVHAETTPIGRQAERATEANRDAGRALVELVEGVREPYRWPPVDSVPFERLFGAVDTTWK